VKKVALFLAEPHTFQPVIKPFSALPTRNQQHRQGLTAVAVANGNCACITTPSAAAEKS